MDQWRLIAAATHGNDPTQGWAAAGLALALAAVAVRGWFGLRGTTLAAPAVWTIAAALAVAAVELCLAANPAWRGMGASLARYAAAVGTLCPLMAVLGAKRPQDRAWQWVVLSLWIVLLVPAGQALAAQGRGEFSTALPWSGLLLGLIALGPLNYLATRWGVAAVTCAFGQYALLAAPLGSSWTSPATVAVGALLLAAVLPTLPRRAGGPAPDEGPLGAFTGRWLAFRNGWGAFWALRVLNRVNETAALSGWPVRLQWTGFAPVEPGGASVPLEPSVAAHLEQTLDTLLRRFESVRRAGRDERG